MPENNSNKSETMGKLLNISEGILSTLTDIILASIFFGFEASFAGYGNTWKASKRVNEDLDRVNYNSIKRALCQLKNRGLINVIKEDGKLPEITEAGRKKLFRVLPSYDDKRIWDNKIYLVTYDIPVKNNSARNKLRRYLKKIGCGFLQDSVWITPYNPTKLISEFVKTGNMENNFIIISSVGKDGSIGGFNRDDLLETVYGLSEINNRYNAYIKWVIEKKPQKSMAVTEYFKILKDDPQIPFPLLPKDWKGAVAYRVFYNSWKK